MYQGLHRYAGGCVWQTSKAKSILQSKLNAKGQVSAKSLGKSVKGLVPRSEDPDKTLLMTAGLKNGRVERIPRFFANRTSHADIIQICVFRQDG